MLAAVALPCFIRGVEDTKAREAVSSLHQIRSGEIIYREQENDYWPSPGGDEQQEIREINETLFGYEYVLDARDNRNWNYSITIPSPDTFIATAEREGGPNHGETITINQDGAIDYSNWTP